MLDIYDQRRQRIQHLEAQVNDLEQGLNNSIHFASQDQSDVGNIGVALSLQGSLVAALAGALVWHAKITDHNELYSLFEDLGVDQSHYRALYDNEEFLKAFPAPHGHNGTHSKSRS